MNPTGFVVVVAITCAGVATGCGSSTSAPPTSSSASPPTGTAGAPVSGTTPDACVLGAWRANFSMTVYPDGATQVNLSGGAGEVLTLNSNGSFIEDLSSVHPLTGSANGHVYSLNGRGRADGHYTAQGGMITYTYDGVGQLVITLTKDGTASRVAQPPPAQTDSYSCAQGASLSTVGAGGGSTQYTPNS
jgi:hypothetical protein